MEDYKLRFQDLLDEAERRAYSPKTGPLLDQAAKLAEKHNDLGHAVLARYLYTFAVAPMKPRRALVAFSWCISHADEADGILPRGSIAQLYGIAIGILRSYPDHTLETIEATFQKMEELYRREGLNFRDIWHQRIYLGLSTGDREGARKAYAKWDQSAPDLDTCMACEQGTRVIYHLHLEEYDRGFALAQPILDGSIVCDHGQPLMTYSATLIPLIRQARLDEATVHFRATMSLFSELGYAGIWVVGRQIAYLALTGDVDAGVDLLRRHYATAMSRGTPADHYGFLLSCILLARRIEDSQNTQHAEALSIILDRGPDPVGASTAAEACERLYERMYALADAFDARNGNSEYRRIAGVMDSVYDEVATR